MAKKEIVIKCENGVQAKQAAKLVQGCSRQQCEIYFEQGNKRVNAKSIMGVISLALKYGDCLTVETKGTDEKKALDEVVSLFNGF